MVESSLTTPADGPREPIWLGHSISEGLARFGFTTHAEPRTLGKPILYDGESHLATVAPTRSGKGVGPIITNLLQYPGPVIVVDPKGENYAVTARRRRELGQRVICLDPFGLTGDTTDRLDPLDVMALPRSDVEGDSKELAVTCGGGPSHSKDPFWDRSGSQLLAGAFAAASMHPDDDKRGFPAAIDLLIQDDISYGLAILLDTVGASLPKMAYRSISSVLQMPDATKGGVIATAQSYLESVTATPVRECLHSSTFSLADVMTGQPLSIYLIIPLDKLGSHRGLLRLWVGVLLKALLCRRNRTKQSTLVFLDEAAQLGPFPALEAMVTLGAGFGSRVWTFWQDLSQIKSHYPETWRTILNNCGVVQSFGFRNRDMVTQWGDFLTHGPEQLLSFRSDEQVLVIHGQGELRCRTLDYRRDPVLSAWADVNPLHQFEEDLPRTPDRDAGPSIG